MSEETARVLEHTFTFPDKMGGGSVKMKELAAKDEIEAAKEAERNGGTGLAYSTALAKMSILEINGEKFTWEDGKADKAWDDMGGTKRRFIIKVYARTFLTDSDEDFEAFFQSSRVARKA